MRWNEIIKLIETASGGATSAGNVAACVSPMGVGFGTDYSASIYGPPKKMPMLRRTNILSKPENKKSKL